MGNGGEVSVVRSLEHEGRVFLAQTISLVRIKRRRVSGALLQGNASEGRLDVEGTREVNGAQERAHLQLSLKKDKKKGS